MGGGGLCSHTAPLSAFCTPTAARNRAHSCSVSVFWPTQLRRLAFRKQPQPPTTTTPCTHATGITPYAHHPPSPFHTRLRPKLRPTTARFRVFFSPTPLSGSLLYECYSTIHHHHHQPHTQPPHTTTLHKPSIPVAVSVQCHPKSSQRWLGFDFLAPTPFFRLGVWRTATPHYHHPLIRTIAPPPFNHSCTTPFYDGASEIEPLVARFRIFLALSPLSRPQHLRT